MFSKRTQRQYVVPGSTNSKKYCAISILQNNSHETMRVTDRVCGNQNFKRDKSPSTSAVSSACQKRPMTRHGPRSNRPKTVEGGPRLADQFFDCFHIIDTSKRNKLKSWRVRIFLMRLLVPGLANESILRQRAPNQIPTL
jgi:hypothetical protein